MRGHSANLGRSVSRGRLSAAQNPTGSGASAGGKDLRKIQRRTVLGNSLQALLGGEQANNKIQKILQMVVRNLLDFLRKVNAGTCLHALATSELAFREELTQNELSAHLDPRMEDNVSELVVGTGWVNGTYRLAGQGAKKYKKTVVAGSADTLLNQLNY